MARFVPRRVASIGAVLAVVLVVTGIAVLLSRPHDHRDARDTLRTVNSLSSDSPAPEATATATATPSHEPAPSAATTPEPVSSASVTAGDGGGTATGAGSPVVSDLGPIPPGSVVFGYEAGRHSWSGTSHDVNIAVDMSPAAPHAGETVTFTIYTSSVHRCCHASMVFGNGRTVGEGECSNPTTATSATTVFTTIYNRGGRFEFSASAASGKDCDGGGDLYSWIEVGSGTSSGQGPAVPVAEVRWDTSPPAHDGDPSYLSLYGDATDDDGFVRHLIVDWGDGTVVTYPGDTDCHEGTDGWPAGSEAWLPANPWGPIHHYKTYGTFRITLTAVSTACDGSDSQRGHGSMTWTNPAPSPSPTPSPSATPSA